jgi:hypothetical protein
VREANISIESDKDTAATTWPTVTLAVALASDDTTPEVAVIVAEPSATEVTRPVLDTVATASFDVVHVTVAPSMTWPFASVTVAVSWVVSVSEPNVSIESDKDTAAATWPTATLAVALASPEVAMIVAEPSATEVTRPVLDTVATEATDVVHVTVAPSMTWPFASVTVAVS